MKTASQLIDEGRIQRVLVPLGATMPMFPRDCFLVAVCRLEGPRVEFRIAHESFPPVPHHAQFPLYFESIPAFGPSLLKSVLVRSGEVPQWMLTPTGAGVVNDLGTESGSVEAANCPDCYIGLNEQLNPCSLHRT